MTEEELQERAEANVSFYRHFFYLSIGQHWPLWP